MEAPQKKVENNYIRRFREAPSVPQHVMQESAECPTHISCADTYTFLLGGHKQLIAFLYLRLESGVMILDVFVKHFDIK